MRFDISSEVVNDILNKVDGWGSELKSIYESFRVNVEEICRRANYQKLMDAMCGLDIYYQRQISTTLLGSILDEWEDSVEKYSNQIRAGEDAAQRCNQITAAFRSLLEEKISLPAQHIQFSGDLTASRADMDEAKKCYEDLSQKISNTSEEILRFLESEKENNDFYCCVAPPLEAYCRALQSFAGKASAGMDRLAEEYSEQHRRIRQQAQDARQNLQNSSNTLNMDDLISSMGPNGIGLQLNIGPALNPVTPPSTPPQTGGNSASNRGGTDTGADLNWSPLNDIAEKIVASKDLLVRSDAFCEFFEELKNQTGRLLDVQIKTDSEEMKRLVAATKYALTSIGDRFFKLNKTAEKRKDWWNKSTGCKQLATENVKHLIGFSDIDTDLFFNATNAVMQGIDIYTQEKEKSPKEFISSVTGQEEEFKNWSHYRDYGKLLQLVESDPEKLAEALYHISYIFFSEIHLTQYSSNWLFNRSEDSNILFLYWDAMAEFKHFAKLYLEGDGYVRDFEDKYMEQSRLKPTGKQRSNLSYNSMKAVREMDSDITGSSPQERAMRFFLIIRKYRFMVQNEKQRLKINKEDYLASIEEGQGIINEVLDYTEALEKRLGRTPVAWGLGVLRENVRVSVNLISALGTADVQSLSQEVFDNVMEKYEDSLETLQEVMDLVGNLKGLIESVDEFETLDRISDQQNPNFLEKQLAAINEMCENINKSLEDIESKVVGKLPNIQSMIGKVIDNSMEEHIRKQLRKLNEISAQDYDREAVQVGLYLMEECPVEELRKVSALYRQNEELFDQVAAAYLSEKAQGGRNLQLETDRDNFCQIAAEGLVALNHLITLEEARVHIHRVVEQR